MIIGLRDWSDRFPPWKCFEEESKYDKELRRKSEERQKLKDMEALIVTARINPAIDPSLVVDMETYDNKLKRGVEND